MVNKFLYVFKLISGFFFNFLSNNFSLFKDDTKIPFVSHGSLIVYLLFNIGLYGGLYYTAITFYFLNYLRKKTILIRVKKCFFLRKKTFNSRTKVFFYANGYPSIPRGQDS